jgi:hypothetical protein
MRPHQRRGEDAAWRGVQAASCGSGPPPFAAYAEDVIIPGDAVTLRMTQSLTRGFTK